MESPSGRSSAAVPLPSWRKRLDLAVLDYCARNQASPEEVIESVSDFLRSASTSREQLLRAELRHRTRNEMQFLISSMRYRQRFAAAGRTDCASCIGQVVALANLNDALYGGSPGERVDLALQCKEIIAAIQNAFHLGDDIRIEVQAEPTMVPATTARNVVLILNEALTNSIKHAFGDEGGTVRVTLAHTSSAEAALTVDDEGSGSGSSNGAKVGGTLIDALATEIGGRIHRTKTGTGFRFSCAFPVD